MDEKTCTFCKQTKPLSGFSTNGKKGIRSQCKECRCSKEKEKRKQNIEAYKEKDKKYYEANKQEVLERNREYRAENREAIIAQKKQYYQENKDGLVRDWHERTKPRRNARLCERRQTDKQFALISSLRSRVSDVLRKKETKDMTCFELLSCSRDHILEWIEHQFTDEMSWDNYAKYWHADHVVPVAFFDVCDNKQKKACFHWSNLKPLPKSDNLSKSDKILQLYILDHMKCLKRYSRKNGYQSMYESTWWPRLELGYGKNPSDEESFDELLKWAIRSQDANLLDE